MLLKNVVPLLTNLKHNPKRKGGVGEMELTRKNVLSFNSTIEEYVPFWVISFLNMLLRLSDYQFSPLQ